MKTSELIFPRDFWWGAATSGPQSESARGRAQHAYDLFYEHAPDRFHDGQTGVNDLASNVEEYAELARVLRFNSLRTSIQWARLLPDGKVVSAEAIRFYRDYFTQLRSRGVRPFVVLSHFDLPALYANEGGWENKKTIEAFVRYADVAFREFGDLVDTWFTFNEPVVQAEGGYLYNFQYPNKLDMRAAMQVQFNMLVAHLKTVNLYKELKKSGVIGIILNLAFAVPRSDHPGDLMAAKWADIFQSRIFLDPIFKHEFPSELLREARRRGYMWDMSSEEEKLITSAKSTDLLGINYYHPLRVQVINHEPNWKGAISPRFYYDTYEMPGRKMNESRGWEIYPGALYAALKHIQVEYGNVKMYVAENGIGISDEARFRNEAGIIVDDYRIEFMREHLRFVKQAIDEGANCVGYHMWTYVDNWSWLNGYKNRYGLFELDLTSGDILPKKSAAWMRRFIGKQLGLVNLDATRIVNEVATEVKKKLPEPV